MNCTTSYSVSDAAQPVYSTIGYDIQLFILVTLNSHSVVDSSLPLLAVDSYALNGVPIYGPMDADGEDGDHHIILLTADMAPMHMADKHFFFAF